MAVSSDRYYAPTNYADAALSIPELRNAALVIEVTESPCIRWICPWHSNAVTLLCAKLNRTRFARKHIAPKKGGQRHVSNKEGQGLPSFRYALEQQEPRVGPGGVTRGASAVEFPVSKGIAGVSM